MIALKPNKNLTRLSSFLLQLLCNEWQHRSFLLDLCNSLLHFMIQHTMMPLYMSAYSFLPNYLNYLKVFFSLLQVFQHYTLSLIYSIMAFAARCVSSEKLFPPYSSCNLQIWATMIHVSNIWFSTRSNLHGLNFYFFFSFWFPAFTNNSLLHWIEHLISHLDLTF